MKKNNRKRLLLLTSFLLIVTSGFCVKNERVTRNGGPYNNDIHTSLLLHLDGDLENVSDYSEDAIPIGDGVSFSANTLPGLEQCLYLSGESNITVPHAEPLSLYCWTIEMWFNLNSLSAQLIDKPAQDYGSNYNIHVEAPDGHMEARYYDIDGERYQISTPPGTINIDQWYHVAFFRDIDNNLIRLVIRDEDFEILYEDSLNVMDSNFPSTSNEDLIIGNDVIGYLDEIRISDTNRDFSQEVQAGFIADITCGEAPLTVNFTDLSAGNPTEWQWDFDNDGVFDSYEQNPSYTYNEQGYYSVLLIVSDSLSTDAELKEEYISICNDHVYPLVLDNWRTHHWPYNAYFPLCSNTNHNHSIVNGHVACSCGPTAVSRILHYWEFPIQGSGSFSFTDVFGCQYSADFENTIYDWENMPNALYENDPEDIYQATATLTYHVATCVNDVNVYGANIDMWIDGLTTYFNYSEDAYCADKDNYSREEWIYLFKNELSHGRPILIVGDNPDGGGHWFICDGYNAENEFHFVFSWGGGADGYYDIDCPYNYSLNLEALIGLQPGFSAIETNFIANVTTGNMPLTVSFCDLSTGNPQFWEWDFNNDGIVDSYEQNPVFIYEEPGLFSVNLISGNAINSNTELKMDYINVESTESSQDDIPGGSLNISNVPNPFNPNTTIYLDIDRDYDSVELSILNIKGQKVLTLIKKTMLKGQYEIFWDGKDDHGRNVASGIYFACLKTDNAQKNDKMILLK